MAVQLITNKVVKKYDTNHPNFNPEPKVKKQVSGNVAEDNDIYNEKVYHVPSEPNGNLKMEEMMGKMMGKLDNLSGTQSQTGTEAVEVDIQREIAISMVDQNAVKSEVTLGKVKTKKDKLRQLRKRR
tara:strand:+ start:165 stop:545 length:381 start_codon:yes stop_codon:yes gene_type:complete